jgi:hypothetical protein
MADAKRALAIRILYVNAVVFGLLALVVWIGVIPVVDSARPMIAAACAVCAVFDILFALLLVSRS